MCPNTCIYEYSEMLDRNVHFSQTGELKHPFIDSLDDYLAISAKEGKLFNLFADQALFQSVFGFSVQDHIENRRVPLSTMMTQLTQLIEERRGELLASQTWTQSSRLGLDS